MSVLVSAFIFTIVILAGKETKATSTCEYSYRCSSTGSCTDYTRTCPDICCGDKTKDYDSICCTSSSNDGAVAGGAVAGIICCIVFLALCYWFCCRTPTRVTTTVQTIVY